MSKPYSTAQIVAEALRRSEGTPTIPDEDFEDAIRGWVSSLPPRTEPYITNTAIQIILIVRQSSHATK